MKPIKTKEYIIAGVTGFLVGMKLFGPLLGIVYLLAGAVCVYFSFRDEKEKVLNFLPYLIYTEIFIRRGANISFVPYLYMQYLMIIVFFTMALRNAKGLRMHSRSLLPIFLYTVVEGLDMTRAHDMTYARNMLTNTVLLLAITFWASTNVIDRKLTMAVVRSLILASVYLAGNVLVAQLTHEISYTVVSSSEAANHMSAVQFSGYMGTGCSLLFVVLMNEKKQSRLFVDIVVFAVMMTLMVLTFSRGGLYFVSAIIIMFMFFNRQQAGKYVILFLLIPVGYIIYSYVSSRTNGLIEERYSQEDDASGRTDLVKAGFTIFFEEPLAGVGTGNYGEEILNRDLYGVESGAHNEFVRAAAEHGILGILFYWGYFFVIIIEVLKRGKQERELAFYMISLFCLIVVHNGLKISLQPFLLAIAISTPALIRSRKKDVSGKAYKKHFVTGYIN